MNGDRWALTDDIVPTCVARLIKTTDLVVVNGDDEYLPPLEDEGDDDSEGPWASWVKADEKADNDDGGDAILMLTSDDTPQLDDLVIDVEFDFDRDENKSNELSDEVAGVGPRKAYALDKAGYTSIADLREADQQELADVEGISNTLAARIKADVDDDTLSSITDSSQSEDTAVSGTEA
jgi:hypothetical protein